MIQKKSIKIMFEEDRHRTVKHLTVHLIENTPNGDEIVDGTTIPPIQEDGGLDPLPALLQKELTEVLYSAFQQRSVAAMKRLILRAVEAF